MPEEKREREWGKQEKEDNEQEDGEWKEKKDNKVKNVA